ncbi:MAG: aminotransferase class I/II-fold pyridoxal phosphate-dependent enzyme [Vicinamibacteria bacterium]|nr:aminotransferase class I/II-fold pyridoxal phosphate-dependent enzyme [Vicinamibacteria bacterium]
MALTRRRFVEALGVAGASFLGSPVRAEQVGGSPAAPGSVQPALDLIKLDQNENPHSPGSTVSKAVMEALTQGNRYPKNAGDLVTAIAKLHGVAGENILLGSGSGELLKASVPAFVDSRRALVAGLPTFETCTNTARSLGLPVREVAVDASLRLDLPAMEDAAGGAGLVFFCNPNNPTGTTWPTKEIEAMIDRLAQRSPETVVMVDEAYAHFVESKDYWSLAPRAARDRRLIVTRTFSKVFGLAGLRIGYAVGHPDTIAALKLTTTSGLLPVTSVAAALAAIGDESLIRDQVQSNRAARTAITKSFQNLGFKVFPSDTNFILVDVQRKPEDFRAACRERGVMVGRPFPGLPSHARISIGTLDEMQRAATVFKTVLAKTA